MKLPDDGDYSIGKYMDEHSLGWKPDNDPETGGALGWVVKMLLVAVFVIGPLAWLVGGTLLNILKAM